MSEVQCIRCGGGLDRPDDPGSDAYWSGMCQVCLHGRLDNLIAGDLARPLDPQVGACACRGAGCWFCR